MSYSYSETEKIWKGKKYAVIVEIDGDSTDISVLFSRSRKEAPEKTAQEIIESMARSARQQKKGG
jgi:hypothetical protein